MRVCVALLASLALATAISWTEYFDKSGNVDYATALTCTDDACLATGGSKDITYNPPILLQAPKDDIQNWLSTFVSPSTCTETSDLAVSLPATHPGSNVVLASAVDRYPKVAPDTFILVTALPGHETSLFQCMPRMPGTVLSIKPLDLFNTIPREASFAVLVALPGKRSHGTGEAEDRHVIHIVQNFLVRSTFAVDAPFRHPISHFTPLNATSFLIATTTFPWSEKQHAADEKPLCRRLARFRCLDWTNATPSRVLAANRRSGNADGKHQTDFWVSSPLNLKWVMTSSMDMSLNDLACADVRDSSFCAAAMTNGTRKSIVLSNDDAQKWKTDLLKPPEIECSEFTAVSLAPAGFRMAVASNGDDCNIMVSESDNFGYTWRTLLKSKHMHVVKSIEVRDEGFGSFLALSNSNNGSQVLFGLANPV